MDEARKVLTPEGGWVLVTNWGIRWHYTVDGVPGVALSGERLPPPPGPRDIPYTNLRGAKLVENVSLSAPDFGGREMAMDRMLLSTLDEVPFRQSFWLSREANLNRRFIEAIQGWIRSD